MASRPRSFRTLAQFTRTMPTPKELSPLIMEIIKETNERSLAIMCSALVDGALEFAIKAKFRKLSDLEAKAIFGADSPLGSFSAKIRIGYALKMYGAQTRTDLNAIREVRNAFAHTRLKISFDTPEVANVAKRISFVERLTQETLDARLSMRYSTACTFLLLYFDAVGRREKRSGWHPGWREAILA